MDVQSKKSLPKTLVQFKTLSKRIGDSLLVLKVPLKGTRVVRLPHDSARPHIVVLTKETWRLCIGKALEHPPYYLDFIISCKYIYIMSLCDYVLFVSPKDAIGGGRINKDQYIEDFVSNWLMTNEQGTDKLPNRWKRRLERGGGYADK